MTGESDSKSRVHTEETADQTGRSKRGAGKKTIARAGGYEAPKGQSEQLAEKRMRRILRIHSAIMCIYFLLLLFTVALTENMTVLLMSVPYFLAYAISFYQNDRWSICFLKGLHQGLMVVFVTAFVAAFGWDCGVQHFIFVLVALVVVVGDGSVKKKTVQTALLLLLRLVLYGYTLQLVPLCRISEVQSICFQVINSVAIFTTLFSCLMLEKQDVWMLERVCEANDRRLARYRTEDPLTGLMNRRSMMEYLESVRETDQLCVAIGDVDFFSRINDRKGHDCGDIILKQLSYRFIKFMEGKGRVARWGGETFLFVFDAAGGEDAYYYLTRLQQQIRTEDFSWKDESLKLTMTFGLMEYSREKGIDYCIVEAGKKMEMGKESGKNTIIY